MPTRGSDPLNLESRTLNAALLLVLVAALLICTAPPMQSQTREEQAGNPTPTATPGESPKPQPRFQFQLEPREDSNLTFAEIPDPTPKTPEATIQSGESNTGQFNPDPRASNEPESIEPPSLFPPVIPPLPTPGEEPLPRSLQLPRKESESDSPTRHKLPYETYPEAERDEACCRGLRRALIAGSSASGAGRDMPILRPKHLIRTANLSSGILISKAP